MTFPLFGHFVFLRQPYFSALVFLCRGVGGLHGFQGLGGAEGPQDAVFVKPGVVGGGQEYDLGLLVRHGGLLYGGVYIGGIDVL